MYFLPRRTIACERILQEAGVAGDVVAGEYPLGFIPFDTDLLSLEAPRVFRVRGGMPLGSTLHAAGLPGKLTSA